MSGDSDSSHDNRNVAPACERHTEPVDRESSHYGKTAGACGGGWVGRWNALWRVDEGVDGGMADWMKDWLRC